MSLRSVLSRGVGFTVCSVTLPLILSAYPVPASSQTQPGADVATSVREQRRQEERIEAIRQRQERTVDVRASGLPEAVEDRLPEGEMPCFQIDEVIVEGDGAEAFRWLERAAAGPAGDDAPQGRCLGTQGINLVLRRMQNALIERGFITSRIGAAAQGLGEGRLVLTLQTGRVNLIRDAEGETLGGVRKWAALPIRAGEVLNLRDVEQALENYKRVPTADTDIKILPAELEGYSDLLIERRQGSPLRGSLSVDDGGVKATGKYQGSLSVAYDNPTGLNDLAYLTLNHDLSGRGGGRGTKGVIAHYSVPVGYWSASATVDHSRNRQTIAGATQNYVYGGRHSNAELRLGRLLHRDQDSKTSLHAGLFRRASSNYIDDTEVVVQRRRAGGWFVAAEHRHYLGRATVDAHLGYRRGTGAFGSIEAPEQAFGEGTSRFGIYTASVSLGLPFELGERAWYYHGHLRGQKDHTRLAPPQQFAIGGRYTVRGFDGETVLSAERGFVLRNEVSTQLGKWGMQGYAGLDYGQVAGPSADLLIGKHLAGAVVGVRGGYRQLRYEVFAGTPLVKPSGFKSPSVTGGVELSYSF